MTKHWFGVTAVLFGVLLLAGVGWLLLKPRVQPTAAGPNQAFVIIPYDFTGDDRSRFPVSPGQIAPIYASGGTSDTIGNFITVNSYGKWTYTQTVHPYIRLTMTRQCLNDTNALRAAAGAAGIAIPSGAQVVWHLGLATGQTAPCDKTFRSGSDYVLQSGNYTEHLKTVYMWGLVVTMAQFYVCKDASGAYVAWTGGTNCSWTDRTRYSASGQSVYGGMTAWERAQTGILTAANTRTIQTNQVPVTFTLDTIQTLSSGVQRVLLPGFGGGQGIELEYAQPGPYNSFNVDGITAHSANSNYLLDLEPDGKYNAPSEYTLLKGKTLAMGGRYLTLTTLTPQQATLEYSSTAPKPPDPPSCTQSPSGTEGVAVTGPNCEQWTLGQRYSSNSDNKQTLLNGTHVGGSYVSKYQLCELGGPATILGYAGWWYRYDRATMTWPNYGGNQPCMAGGPPPQPIAPTIAIHPQSQAVTVGTPVTFSVSANGTAPFTYQWRRNNEAITGATFATYTIPSAQSTHAGTYRADVSNAAGSTTSNDAVLTVNPANSVTPPAGWELLPSGDIRRVECSPTSATTCWEVVGESINAVTRSRRMDR